MAYEKQSWVDNTTPVDAEHLNHMESGISANADDITSLNADLTDIDILNVGTAISAGEDLNDYTTPGVYHVASSSVAANIINSPTTSTGYKLLVFNLVSTTNWMQIALLAHTNTTVFQLRTKTSASGDWTAWRQVAYA